MRKRTIKPASELRLAYYGDGEITEQAINILETVEQAVGIALENGAVRAKIELPTVLQIGQMDLETSQANVYYKVLVELEKNGYLPTFEYRGSGRSRKVILRVSWLTDKDEEFERHIKMELSKRVHK